MDSHLTYLGVGSNLLDRVQNILDARNWLASNPVCSALRSASLYWSSPVGYLDQPGFINTVFELRVACTPLQLLSEIQSYEHSAGRRRDPNNQNAPRIIDLDILLFGKLNISDEQLTIPHPRMIDRRFVMEPLLELKPSQEILSLANVENYQEAVLAGTMSEQEVFRLGG